jgi:hypothetical protein
VFEWAFGSRGILVSGALSRVNPIEACPTLGAGAQVVAEQNGEIQTAILDTTDTVAMDFPLGGRVKCVMGALKGVSGVVTGSRSGGRLLVKVAYGVLIELPRVCLRRLEPSG